MRHALSALGRKAWAGGAVAMAFAALFTATACSENLGEEESHEHDNWQARNEAFFQQKKAEARAAIAAGQTDWLLLRSYSLGEGTSEKLADSVCVEILERGTATESPIFTDTVRYNYALRLIPTALHPEGEMVDHSGRTMLERDIFNLQTAVPLKLSVNNHISGMVTALQQMHVGDRWRIYVPASLGYGKTEQTSIPAYSTLIFDVQLLDFYHVGTPVPAWR